VVSCTPRPHFTPGIDPVPILQEAGWAPGPVWTGGNSRPHWDSIPDRPDHSSVAIPTQLTGPQTHTQNSDMLRPFLNNFQGVFTSVKDINNVYIDGLINRSKFWSTKCADFINHIVDVHAEIVHQMWQDFRMFISGPLQDSVTATATIHL